MKPKITKRSDLEFDLPMKITEKATGLIRRGTVRYLAGRTDVAVALDDALGQSRPYLTFNDWDWEFDQNSRPGQEEG